MSGLCNSWDEWTRLERVVVGDIGHATAHHFDPTFKAFYWDNVRSYLDSADYDAHVLEQGRGDPVIPIEDYILAELNEDIEEFCNVLRSLGVVVERPAQPAEVADTTILTPFWQSFHSPALNVRDNAIIFGNCVVETAPHVRSRIFENFALRSLFSNHFTSGGRWLTMPLPTLVDGSIDLGYFAHSRKEMSKSFDQEWLLESDQYGDMIFDGAQCVRFGKDVIVNVASKNHELGLQWLMNELGSNFRYHVWKGVTDGHLDSTIMPLRAGLLLLRNREVQNMLPPFLSNWDCVFPPEPTRDLFPTYENTTIDITSKFIDLNVLSVDHETVIVNALYPELIKTLELFHMNVIPVRHRHRRLFGGGFHCFTLDLNRRGTIEDYS